MEVASRPSQPRLSYSQPRLADPVSESKLTIEKFADGPIACLKFIGTIDESFDGKKIAKSVQCDWLVLDLGGVKKISSFGIREWVDFMGAATKQSKSIILIECAPKVVDQLNMVANFAGGGQVYSFYAPFRCDYCDSEHRALLDVGKDFEAIKSMKVAERPCPSCKESMYFDEDGSTFFSYILGQGQFELEPEVVAFLSAKLDYRVGTIDAKLRVDKIIDGRITYLRLAGGLDNTFPREKLVEGLEGTVIVDLAGVSRVEPAGAAEWRSFVQQVTPLVETMYLTGVTPVFLEKLCRIEDLGLKTQVVDFTLPYACKHCGQASARPIDVGEHRSVLKFATAPELPCPNCKATMQSTASEAQMLILPGLPTPVVAKDLQHKLAELRMRKLDKKASSGLPQVQRPAAIKRGIGAGTLALAIVIVAVLGGAGVLAYSRLTTKDPGPLGLGPVTSRSAAARPTWITSDRPGAVDCKGDVGVICVGVSEPLASQEEAEDEASDAAYEGVAFELAKDKAVAAINVGENRAAAYAAVQRDPQSTQAKRDVHDGRHAAARVIKRGVGPVTARYWEAYDTIEGKKYIAFAQVGMARGDASKWIARAKLEASALGATVVDYVPELGWRYPKLDHGAVVTRLDHGVLQDLGLAEHYVVLAVNGHDVADAAAFAKLATSEFEALVDKGGPLRLLVQTENGDPREFATQIPGKPVPPILVPDHGGKHPTGDHSTGVNVWDRFGGNRGSGRDDPTQ
jgi:anti-anti-sigma regulatory factor